MNKMMIAKCAVFLMSDNKIAALNISNADFFSLGM